MLDSRNNIIAFGGRHIKGSGPKYMNSPETLLYQKRRIEPEPGTIVIWPAQWTHQHKGNMVLEGNKYIVTGWIHNMWTDQHLAGHLVAPDNPPGESELL